MNFFITLILLAMTGLFAALLFVKDPSEQQLVRVFVPVAPQLQISN